MEFGIGLIPQNNAETIIEIGKLSETVGFKYYGFMIPKK